MLTCRSAMGVAVLGDQIFIIGGYDGIHSLNSVEVYVVIVYCHLHSLYCH